MAAFLTTTWLFVSVTLILATTKLYTTYQWTRAVNKRSSHDNQNDTRIGHPPPTLAYTIPILGSTITFSDSQVGNFWSYLLSKCHKHDLSAISIMLMGSKIHFFFTSSGVASVFKSRQLTRYKLDRQLGRNALAMSKNDAERCFPMPSELDVKEKLSTEKIHAEMLLSTPAVNALTSKFMEVFEEQVMKQNESRGARELSLYGWIRDEIFKASTTALYGSTLLEMFPDFAEDFWKWDDGLVGMILGRPRFLAREAYGARDSCVAKLQRWLEAGYAVQAGEDDVTGIDWEPNFGAKVTRRRHAYYDQQGMTLHGQAGADLIFLGGILSNAVPTIGWMLLQLMAPWNSQILSDVLNELRTVTCSTDSSTTVNIATLVNLPLLNAVFHETLRLYADVLITRQVESAVVLDGHLVKQGSMAMAPSWMAHRNSKLFEGPHDFIPSRFLREDKESGKKVFSMNGFQGQYFPFGGGHYMCPGRNFAKQEVLGAVAVVLLNFNVEFVGFTGHEKSSRDSAHVVGSRKDYFPKMKDNYAGNVVVGIEGDALVRVSKSV